MKRNYSVIIDYLKQETTKDAELFRRTYIFRSSWGVESVYILFALMDGYRRLIPFFDMPEIEDFDRYFSNPMLSMDYPIPAVVNIRFLSKHGLLSNKRKVIAQYSIPTSHLEHVFGTTREFVIMTLYQKVRLTSEGVEIDFRSKSFEPEEEFAAP